MMEVITASTPMDAETDRPTRWGVVTLLTLALFCALMVGGMLSPLQEAVKAELHLNDIDIGLLAGTATAVPIAFLSLPVAWLVDHGNRARLLAVLASLWAAGTIATAFAPSFTALFACRLVAGIGAGCVFPVLISLLADVCMPQRRGRSLLLVSIGAWAGAAAAFAIGGTLFGHLAAHPGSGLLGLSPWRETHLLVGIGTVVAIVPLLFLREPPRYEVEQTSVSLRSAADALWRRRSFLGPLLLGTLAGVMAEGAAAIWMGSLLVRQYHQSPGSFGGWVGIVILVSGVVGSVIGGFAADAAGKLKWRGAILLPATVATAITIPATAYSIMPTVTGFAWVLFVLLLGGVVVGLVSSTSVAVLIPNEDRAVTLAGMKIATTLVTAGVAPPLVVWLSALNSGPFGLGKGVAVMGGVTHVLSLVGFWFAMRGAPLPVAPEPHASSVLSGAGGCPS